MIQVESSNLTPVSLFCPNCGRKIIGFKGDDGSLRIKCDTCKAVIFSKRHTRKEINLKVVASN